MNSQKKIDTEKRRQQQALKSMYFNRFLLVRFITALFFFGLMNWTLAMILVNTTFALVPLCLFGIVAVAAYEQVRLYSHPKDDAALTTTSYKALAVSLLVLLGALFSPLYTALFPFLHEAASKQGVASLTAFALLLSVVVLRRLHQIKHRQDKQFQRIQAMQTLLN